MGLTARKRECLSIKGYPVSLHVLDIALPNYESNSIFILFVVVVVVIVTVVMILIFSFRPKYLLVSKRPEIVLQ